MQFRGSVKEITMTEFEKNAVSLGDKLSDGSILIQAPESGVGLAVTKTKALNEYLANLSARTLCPLDNDWLAKNVDIQKILDAPKVVMGGALSEPNVGRDRSTHLFSEHSYPRA